MMPLTSLGTTAQALALGRKAATAGARLCSALGHSPGATLASLLFPGPQDLCTVHSRCPECSSRDTLWLTLSLPLSICSSFLLPVTPSLTPAAKKL